MPIHVEYLLRYQPQMLESRFLPSLAQGRSRQVRFTVHVSAQLKPTIELAVMGKQSTTASRIYDPSGGRKMSLQTGTLQAVRVGSDEGHIIRQHRRFLTGLGPGLVLSQQCYRIDQGHVV
jgi:hypothetical protein